MSASEVNCVSPASAFDFQTLLLLSTKAFFFMLLMFSLSMSYFSIFSVQLPTFFDILDSFLLFLHFFEIFATITFELASSTSSSLFHFHT